MKMIDDCRYHLVQAGIPMPDADALRRISMTLHRWHEMECGDSNQYGSWAIVRGRKVNGAFEHDDDGKPYIERHNYRPHMTTKGNASVTYSAIADREKGARKRLAAIMAKYPTFTAYVQGDPRGAALYILRAGDVPEGADVSAYYSRGLAVHK